MNMLFTSNGELVDYIRNTLQDIIDEENFATCIIEGVSITETPYTTSREVKVKVRVSQSEAHRLEGVRYLGTKLTETFLDAVAHFVILV